jgi:hypothetical protein
MFRPTVPSASLSWCQTPIWGLRPDFCYCQDSCMFVDVGRSLWWENGSAIYNCCYFSPAQSFLGPSTLALVTIFYCLRFETSLFVASYDSKGHGGGIRPRLHTDKPLNRTNSVAYKPRNGNASQKTHVTWSLSTIVALKHRFLYCCVT